MLPGGVKDSVLLVNKTTCECDQIKHMTNKMRTSNSKNSVPFNHPLFFGQHYFLLINCDVF